MKCRECQSENPKSAKFCVECGNKLEIKCPKCGFGNSPSFKFCAECGHNINHCSGQIPKDLSFDEKLEKIQRYLPKGLTEKILSQKDRIEGERKQVTVMFCDMEGFTSLSERLGPEETYAIIDKVYEILIHKVHDFEGTVNEMTGDGIVALFGAPIALEDAPQRAIRSALTIHREMVKFSDKVRDKNQTPAIKMRIGIHTGPVVVGTVGNNLRVEFKAVGDTVNLASRVEKIAEPGTTYVTEDIFKLTEGLFRFESLGESDIKGKEEPVKVYRVLAPSTRRTRFDVSSESGLTPFIGRERELELLLDGFERAKSGRGQAFSIFAEAGLGKSRLLYELRKAIANDDVTFLEGKSLSYSRDVAYHPIIDILRINFYILENDTDFDIKEKVKTGLLKLQINEDPILPYFLELLSVKESGINDIPINPETLGDRIREALKQVVLKGSEVKPLIIAVEDLHWIDKSSEDTLKYLLENISGAKVLLLFTCRPEFIHTWGGRSYHSQLNLMRLSNRESLSMVSFLLGSENIDLNLGNLILDKTEGVPFFIEEFIKSLKDLNIISKKNDTYQLKTDFENIVIPSHIQDVIMARVDSLSEDAKEVLQIGSVIGREFRHNLIEKVTEISEQDLLSQLAILKNSELLYERGIYPESSYIFKHALTQESVYQSLIKSVRQKYHQMIAEVLEQQFPEIIEKEPESLGYHYTNGDTKEKAIPYWQKAAEFARRRSANNEAIANLNKGLELLKDIPNSPWRMKHEIDMTLALGSVLMIAKGQAAPEVEQTYSRALNLCQQAKDSSQTFPAMLGLCAFYQGQGRHQKPHEMAKQLLTYAQSKQEPTLLLRAHHMVGTSFFYIGEIVKSTSHFDQAIANATHEHYSFSSIAHATDSGVACRAWKAWNLWYLGYPERALIKSKKACAHAQKLSHPHSIVFALLFSSRVHQYRRAGESTQELAEKVITLSIEYGFPLRMAAGTFMRGWALAEQGNLAEGVAQMHQGVTQWQATGAKTNLTYYPARLAEMYGKAGEPLKGLGLINEALNFMAESEERFCEAELYQIKGNLLLQQADHEEHQAESCYHKAIEVARKQKAKSLELRAAISMSRLWQGQGKIEEAHNFLSDIYKWFTEGFDTADLIDAKALLEELC